MERDRVPIKSVHDDDLLPYLAGLGIAVDKGVVGSCKFCRNQVTTDNLTALFPESGAIKLVCNRAACMVALQELVRDGRVKL